MNTPMNQEQYATAWKAESKSLDSKEIYQKLSELVSSDDVLEIGCGVGIGTYYLSKKSNVLSLDNNPHLISEAKVYLDSKKVKYQIQECDLFTLTEEDKNIIQKFKPKAIVGWFIGSDGMNVLGHTEEENNINNKGKLYREKLEDIIVSSDICIDSVDTISFAIRAHQVENVSDEELFASQKNDYDTHVFNNIDFEVCHVAYIDWSRQGSDFQYSHADNPNLASGNLVPVVLSITAKRKDC